LNIRPWLITLALGGAALAGCGQPVETPPKLGAIGPIPESPQRTGDPELGYEILVNRGYVSCGVPFDAYAARAPEERDAAALPGRLGRNAELPYDLNATVDDNGVELVVSNCLVCHGGHFDGELVIGLGNAFADFSSNPMRAIESVGLLVEDGAPAAAWQRWADRIAAIAPYMVTDTVGVNPAPNLTMALMAHRDPETLRWFESPQLTPPPREPLPTAVPPWWRMQKKNAMFYHGGGRGDQVPYMMLKSLVCTDELEEARIIDGWFTHVRAYIATLQPPDWPYAIDASLAAAGKPVFEQNCVACHGSYEDDWTYPNLLIGLEQVGTDSAYALQAIEAERFIRWFNGSFYGKDAQAQPGPGYVAPPLDAVWATAPYLHNDSVPSIAALLDSRLRPTYWRHLAQSKEYDVDALGWHHEVLDYGKEGAADAEEARSIYDTTRLGYGNAGHTFGDALSDAERRALIEYLKTL